MNRERKTCLQAGIPPKDSLGQLDVGVGWRLLEDRVRLVRHDTLGTIDCDCSESQRTFPARWTENIQEILNLLFQRLLEP